MTAKDLVKAILPPPLRRWLRSQQLHGQRFFGRFRSDANLGSLRRTIPVSSTDFGGSRGQIIDRYYIEKFLAEHAGDVRGHVLDFCDDSYARRFGGAKATKVDVLHLTEGNLQATIVADLARGEAIPSDTFDCIICTQVLLLIYEVQAAVRTLYRILKPGGVVLVTAPGIQKISRGDMNISGDYWRFTTLSLLRLFAEVFPKDRVEVKAYGNVLAAVAFLHGFAVEDLRREDLEYRDPDFQVLIALRAVKP
ncbi:MAG: methyltransferase domain-containing protein [Terriglobia bacterium]|jgi:SAM-dependent methyltransferase